MVNLNLGGQAQGVDGRLEYDYCTLCTYRRFVKPVCTFILAYMGTCYAWISKFAFVRRTMQIVRLNNTGIMSGH